MRYPGLLAFVAVTIMMLTGCTNRPAQDPLVEASYCQFLDSLAENTVTPLKVIEGNNGGLMTSQILLKNKTNQVAKLFIRAKFYDNAGREVSSSFGQWNWKSILAREETSYSTVAPNDTVVKIMFEIRSANPKATVRPGKR